MHRFISSTFVQLDPDSILHLFGHLQTVNICSEDGKICPDSFQPAQWFAYDVMERM